MLTRCLGKLMLVGACAVPPPVLAEGEATGCRNPSASPNPLMDRSGSLSAYEALPQDCLKHLFMACAAESNVTVLDFGRAVVCSLGHEALLRQGFNGDFDALISWWRSNRDTWRHPMTPLRTP